ncbi:MAG: ChaN family lipoprotein [Bacteroidota bacterium]|uniref:ChaN family lipoprotein n=1 Tax=Flagellimonas profundi TaxID=2915620 RepID=A0ABS3FDT9_9FLAO|nr:ChaN family lipoprotein [Allomuricauda profundi]MBO0341313.1 ChaN family lipoprotein [Allomuricauda profundi]MEC7771200.1 ChaN family lipoprotein [Bacteroidota bacterium]
MKKVLFLLAFILNLLTLTAQKEPYVIYNAKGKKVSYKKMLKTLENKDMVLFGELHNNPIAHWLQYELTADLNAKRPLILGAEMIETDNQDELNDYLSGKIDYKALDSTARLWKNHKTDYAPLVDFAKDSNLVFVASNVPRRYASMVYNGGFEALDSLPAQEKEWIAPLPIAFDPELPGYQNILKMMGDHGSPTLVMAQAIKDATMAHFILQNYEEGSLFLHYNGAYHSNDYEGILWYLQLERPDLEYGTISTVTQENVHDLEEENRNVADFIICVDQNMTTTY